MVSGVFPAFMLSKHCARKCHWPWGQLQQQILNKHVPLHFISGARGGGIGARVSSGTWTRIARQRFNIHSYAILKILATSCPQRSGLFGPYIVDMCVLESLIRGIEALLCKDKKTPVQRSTSGTRALPRLATLILEGIIEQLTARANTKWCSGSYPEALYLSQIQKAAGYKRPGFESHVSKPTYSCRFPATQQQDLGN